MYFFPLWWGLDWSKWGRGLARNIIYNQNIIVINDKCSCSEDIHKKFFSTLRRVWLIKGRRGGGGGLAGNRDFPGYIPVLSPTVNPINQSKQWNASQNDIKQVSEEWANEGYWYICRHNGFD